MQQDRGDTAKSASTMLMVMVKDNDDLPPKFTESIYRTKINEFSPITVSCKFIFFWFLFLYYQTAFQMHFKFTKINILSSVNIIHYLCALIILLSPFLCIDFVLEQIMKWNEMKNMILPKKKFNATIN